MTQFHSILLHLMLCGDLNEKEVQKGGDICIGASQVALVIISLPGWELQETWVQSWVGKIPWRRKWQPTSVFLPGESHGQRSLEGLHPTGSQ